MRDQQRHAEVVGKPRGLVGAEVEPHDRTARRTARAMTSAATVSTVATVLPRIWPGTKAKDPNASGTNSTLSMPSPTRFEPVC